MHRPETYSPNCLEAAFSEVHTQRPAHPYQTLRDLRHYSQHRAAYNEFVPLDDAYPYVSSPRRPRVPKKPPPRNASETIVR
jgi:hypothetical protein